MGPGKETLEMRRMSGRGDFLPGDDVSDRQKVQSCSIIRGVVIPGEDIVVFSLGVGHMGRGSGCIYRYFVLCNVKYRR